MPPGGNPGFIIRRGPARRQLPDENELPVEPKPLREVDELDDVELGRLLEVDQFDEVDGLGRLVVVVELVDFDGEKAVETEPEGPLE